MSALGRIIESLERGSFPPLAEAAELAHELGGSRETAIMLGNSQDGYRPVMLYLLCLLHRQQSEV